MTQEVLAERAGLTPNFIGGIEIGKRDPSLSTMLKLAKGLGVEPAELFTAVGDLSPQAAEAGRLYDKTVVEVQDAVGALLRAVAKPSRR